MKAIELLEKLRKRPVFRVQDVETIAYCSRGYAWLTLGRLAERGLVRKVARNAYTMSDDINAIATNLTYPSYLSFLYASYFLGYTEQIVNTVQVAVTVKKKAVEFEGYRIRFVPVRNFFGYRKIHGETGDIFVAEDEKLLIDACAKPAEMGNFEEFEKLFRNAKISREKMVRYLKRAGSQGAIKRVGYLLEKTRGIDIRQDFELDRNYFILDPISGKWSEGSAKWRIKA